MPGRPSDTRLRLDQEIAARYPSISRRKAREMIAGRRVLVDGHLVAVSSRLVSHAQALTLFEELPAISLLAESKEWLAVDKPAGVPTQPTRERDRPSLLEMVTVALAARDEPHQVYPVHRLDSGTSGVLLIARSSDAAHRLTLLLGSAAARKEYHALLSGVIESELAIDEPIGREGLERFAVSAGGRPAQTHFRPLARGPRATFVSAAITHGRTHQIRVHASHAGHPVIGDRKYGGPAAARLMLHASAIEHPGLGLLTAPLPEEFRLIASQFGVEV